MQTMQTIPGLGDRSIPDAGVPGRLRANQVMSLAVLGVVAWLLAALFIRCTMGWGFFSPAASVPLFALTVPGAWTLAWIGKRVGPLLPSQLVPGVAVACAAAMLCDGIALTWTPTLYGGASANLLPAAAWLLWGVGVIFAVALISARRGGV